MKKIMLVDDEPHVVRLLRVSLERAGYQIETAHHGESAMVQIRMALPDVLITDINMPKMDGEELCTKIQSEFPERLFLIIVSTSRTEAEHRAWSENIGNLIFLEKPLSVRKLIEVLDDYFKLQALAGVE